MLFSELYSAYYNAVAAILREALEGPVTPDTMRRIIGKHASNESALTIVPALTDGRWPLLREDGTPVIRHVPTMPLTTLQKQWINAISRDPRMRLLIEADGEEAAAGLPFPEEDVLFTPEDVCVYDAYADGDPYEDPAYRAHFREILRALREGSALRMQVRNRHGNPMTVTMMPDHLEYSEKDDKFRLYGNASHRNDIVNLARIESVERCEREEVRKSRSVRQGKPAKVEFLLLDERKALERVMLHFAHLEKRTEKLDEKNYRVTLYYDGFDETELLIRLLSFGPLVKVVEPGRFLDLIRERLTNQSGLDL